MSIEIGTSLVHKWAPKFGLGNFRITVQPITTEDATDAWAMSFFDTHEEWGLVELPADESLPVGTLELLVLHELAHGLLKLVGGDGDSPAVEATCNRIARLARRDFVSPLMNEHSASVHGNAWFADGDGKRSASVDRRVWLPLVTDGLPSEERQVITLLYWEGLSLRQAAEVTGLPVRTLRRRLESGLKRMADCFAALDKKFGEDTP